MTRIATEPDAYSIHLTKPEGVSTVLEDYCSRHHGAIRFVDASKSKPKLRVVKSLEADLEEVPLGIGAYVNPHEPRESIYDSTSIPIPQGDIKPTDQVDAFRREGSI